MRKFLSVGGMQLSSYGDKTCASLVHISSRKLNQCTRLGLAHWVWVGVFLWFFWLWFFFLGGGVGLGWSFFMGLFILVFWVFFWEQTFFKDLLFHVLKELVYSRGIWGLCMSHLKRRRQSAPQNLEQPEIFLLRPYNHATSHKQKTLNR